MIREKITVDIKMVVIFVRFYQQIFDKYKTDPTHANLDVFPF